MTKRDDWRILCQTLMNERWNDLLAAAEQLLPHYLEATAALTHATKGIRRSELFFLYALTAPRCPRRILESGRGRAQSTLVLARLFPETSIVSLEAEATSPDAAIAAERLRGYANVECRFGDSRHLLPSLVEKDDVVLIDGPKDFRALKLAFHLLKTGRPTAVFVHDLWLGSPARAFVDRFVPGPLLSDEPRWVERYASLDSKRNVPPPRSPNDRRAYGATLACFEKETRNYDRLLFRCSAAQGGHRLREIRRKILRQAPKPRPQDFASG
jgi:predicted O-methyltransferase YrrM